MQPIAALFIVTSTFLAPASPPVALDTTPQVDFAAMFPPPKEGLTITVVPGKGDADEATTFPKLLDDFTRVTGITLQVTKDTEGVLKQTRLGLNRSIQVPASEVYRIVETLLIAHDFVFIRLSNRDPRIWMVQSLQAGGGRGGPQVRNDALMVDEKDLRVLEDHPATLVTTTISLPKTDVRTLSNSMRTLFTDANTQQIIPVGQSSLIITGFAPNVAGLVRLLHTIDDLSTLEGGVPNPAVQVRPGAAGK
ncbi:MAG: hypothetical protein HZA53_15755 [Planctomycetes bacterium]|nr:hypothetical protein [Planctomycetota bacterium]